MTKKSAREIFIAAALILFSVPVIAEEPRIEGEEALASFGNAVVSGPAGLTASAAGMKVSLLWEAVEGASSYNIYRSEDPAGQFLRINKEEVRSPSFVDSPKTSLIVPESGKTYYYKVTSFEAGKESPDSGLASAKPEGGLLPPEDIKAIAGTGEVIITWTEPESGGVYGVSGYNIFRSLQQDSEGDKVNAFPMPGFKFTDKGSRGVPLTVGTEYFYRMQSVDTAGNTSAVSGLVSAKPFSAASMPSDVTTKASSGESIKISWREPQKGTYEISGYNIYRSNAPDAFPDKPVNLKLVRILTDEEGRVFYHDNMINSVEPPQQDKEYYYRVVPVDVMGNTGNPSEPARAKIDIIEIKQSGIITAELSEYGLPADSNLTISGVKWVKIGYTKVFQKDVLNFQGQKDFIIDQGLRVNLQGTIGKKITVDVNYDDSLETDENRKIFIKYQGEKEETVQEVSFGDITLDLPSTRYTSFNQSLFGIKGKVKIGDKLTLTAIGAQTKGIPDKQVFKGNMREQDEDNLGKRIYDSDYYYNTYYYLTKDRTASKAIKPGTVVIYHYQYGSYPDANTISSYPAKKYAFRIKTVGTDYTVDYVNRVVKFNFGIQDGDVIAVAYELMNGESVGYNTDGSFDLNEANLVSASDGMTSNNAHLIQNGLKSDLSHKVLSYYYLGATQIENPKSSSGFSLRIYENTGGNKEFPVLQPGQEGSDIYYEIDSDLGILKFKSYYPFAVNSTTLDPNNNNTTGNEADCYNITERKKLFYMVLYYKYYVPSYTLENTPVVAGSERVIVNGQLMKKDKDYYIFYETGEVVFIDKNLVQSNTNIEIVYEYYPFMQTMQSTLAGGRLDYNLFDNLSLGSTVLYKSAATGSTIPDARSTDEGLSTPYAMIIYDADTKLKLPKESINYILNGLPFVEKADVPVDAEVRAEIAYSDLNVNIYERAGVKEKGVAMIDSMEGAENVLATSVDEKAWFPASAPQGFNIANRNHMSKQNLTEESHELVDPNDLTATNKQLMLKINYNNLGVNEWDAFRYVLSSYGESLNLYNYIDMWVYVETDREIRLNVDLGIVSEDSNGNIVLDSEDPKRTGVYEDAKDIGIDGSHDPYWGSGNEMLDTEDMNNNGTLDSVDAYYSYFAELNNDLVFPAGYKAWKQIRIPLRGTAANPYNFGAVGAVNTDKTSQNFLSLIRVVRLSIRGASTAPANGFVKIESVKFTGNSWQLKTTPLSYDLAGNLIDSPDTAKLNVESVNRNTDAGYTPNTNYYDFSTEEEKNSEEALRITHNLSSLDVRPDGKPIYYSTKLLSAVKGFDYSPYSNLRFDALFGKKKNSGVNRVFFVRLGTGSDFETSYYQYNVIMDDIPDDGGWHTITLKLDGSDKKRSDPVGYPNLSTVNYISIGVINPNGTADEEVIYINNIRLTDPVRKTGLGKYLSSLVTLTGFGTAGHVYEESDTDFYTTADMGRTPIKQHKEMTQATFKYNQLSFLPVDNAFTNTKTYTEGKYRKDPSYTRNYTLADVFTDSYENRVEFNAIPGVGIFNRTSFKKEKYAYLSDYVYNDRKVEELLVNPHITYSAPQEIKMWEGFAIPLGSNSFDAAGEIKNTYMDFSIPQPLTFCVNNYDQWNLYRRQDYRWNGSYRFDKFAITPSYEYIIREEKGNTYNRYPYYYGLFSDNNYIGRYIVTERQIMPKVTLQVSELGIFSPQLDYSMMHKMDYTQSILYTTANMAFSTKVALSKMASFLPDISNYRLSVDNAEQYRETVYPGSLAAFEKLPLEEKWAINLYEKIIDEKKVKVLEDLSYDSSLRTRHDLYFSEIKIADKFGFTPSGSYDSGRKASQRTLNYLSRLFSVSANSIYFSGVTIPGLEFLFKDEKITGNYSYSDDQKIDPIDQKTIFDRTIRHTGGVQLPFKLNFNTGAAASGENKLTGSIKMDVTTWKTTYRQDDSENWSLNPAINVSYNLNIKDPVTIPGWIPLIGNKTFRFEQALVLSLAQSAVIDRKKKEDQQLSSVAREWNLSEFELYATDFKVSYDLLKNIKTSVGLTYQHKTDHIAPDKYSYDSLGAAVEVWAYF